MKYIASYSIYRLMRIAIPILITLIIPVFAMKLFVEINRPEKTKKSIHENYFRYLEAGINTNQFGGKYCKTAFNHYDRKSNGAFTKYGYVELLEDFIVYMNAKKPINEGASFSNYEKVMNILDQAITTEPFAALPSEERRLMDNIQIFIQNSDIDNSLNTLNELKQVILSRHKEYEKIERQNLWTIPLAFAGIALTFLFGVWTIIRALKKDRRQRRLNEMGADFYSKL